MQLENEALKLTTDYNTYAEAAMEVYKFLNQETFQAFSTIDLFKTTLDALFTAHKQTPVVKYTPAKQPIFVNNNKVLVCCSGGLDSVYQALFLRYSGFDVTLFHVDNINKYTNGQEKKVFLEFAEKFNFSYFMPKVSAVTSGEYKKFWQENSFKNFLIYSMAVDYMLANNICFLSSGDDLRLDIAHSVCGTNTSDCKELTIAFMKTFGINFIPLNSATNKAQRLKFLYDKDAGDYYISCVGPGRLIQTQHNRYENKYGIKLDKWCCTSCRKCCMHILLNKYYNNQAIPEELEEHCWNKLAIGADNIYFDKSIPLEKRIKNLIDY